MIDVETPALPLEEALAQGDRVADLLRRARALRSRVQSRGVDRVPHTLQQSFTFKQGENTSGPLVFQSPSTHEFEAHRLALYPEIRLVSVRSANGTSEITYRPTHWTHAVMVALTSGPLSQIWANVLDRLLDAQVELTLQIGKENSREMQSAPFPVAQCFSGAVNSDTVGGTLVTSRPGLLVFQRPVMLRPGRSLLCKITPTFSGTRTLDARQNEYRITAVLEGAKVFPAGGGA